MWAKLEKIYKKYIKSYDKNVVNLINSIICLKILDETSSLETYDIFKKRVEQRKINLILSFEFDKNWEPIFNKLIEEINHIDIKSNKDVVNLGYLFEKTLNRKKRGTYYTPVDVTEYIAHTTIIASLASRLNIDDNFKIKDKNTTVADFKKYILKNNLIDPCYKAVSEIKILDPTCGSGAFLIAAFQLLYDLNKFLIENKNSKVIPNKIIYHTINSLYGVDIEEIAISITKFLFLTEILTLDGKEDLTEFSWDNFKVGNTLWGDTRTTNTDDFQQQMLNTDNDSSNNEPFLWKKEFGFKFDCIIGNPPYVELHTAKSECTINTNFETIRCGNIYPLILERSLNLLKESGILGMIIPISFISTNRMTPIYELIRKNSSWLYISSFADRPGCLFSGVHQKLNIIFSQKKSENKSSIIYTSNYIHWYKEERKKLFNNVSYVENYNKTKVGNATLLNILKKVNSQKKTLLSIAEKNATNYKVFLNARAAFFIKTSLTPEDSNEFKCIYMPDEDSMHILNAVINSNLVFVLWEVYSDCWHVPLHLDFVKFNWDGLDTKTKQNLVNLSNKLDKNLEKNKVEINSKQSRYEYKHKYAKHIMDQIDDILGQLYSFTGEELNVIKNYNEKYRLSDYYEKHKLEKQN